jgi:hypothetical protein
METNRGPLARSEGLIVEEIGDEVLVYDSNVDTAHCLSPDAARVWQRCDGRTPSDGLAAQVGLSAERVESALSELERCELLEEPGGHTRRQMGLKVVKAGAAVAATPLIISVMAPTPAMATTFLVCATRSSNNCGGNDGCSSVPGCCCCTPPVSGKSGYCTSSVDCPACGPGHPCCISGTNDSQCKSCVPTEDQATLCPLFGHSDPNCSSEG